jgi:hypothetical protein
MSCGTGYTIGLDGYTRNENPHTVRGSVNWPSIPSQSLLCGTRYVCQSDRSSILSVAAMPVVTAKTNVVARVATHSRRQTPPRPCIFGRYGTGEGTQAVIAIEAAEFLP